MQDHVFNSPEAVTGWNKTQGSSTIMSTSFALKFWSNKKIDVDIILSITLAVIQKLIIWFYHEKICAEIGGNLYKFSLFQVWLSAILDNNIEKLG